MSDEAIQALEEAIQALEEATGKYKAPDLDCARGAFEQQVGLVAAGTPLTAACKFGSHKHMSVCLHRSC